MEPAKRFEEHTSLVGYVFQRQFSKYTAYQEDLIQEGYLGLWKACLAFNESKGVQFSTYAYTAIERNMHRYVNNFILKHVSVISLDSVVVEDGEGNQLQLKDMLGTEEDYSIKYTIQDSLQRMSEKECNIVHKLMCGYTQDQVAKACKTSQSSVHRCLLKFKRIYLKERNKEY